MKKKNVKTAPVAKAFDLDSLVPESDVTLIPRTNEETVKMYEVLDKLAVGQSYRMPMNLIRTFTNAKVTHKRVTKKVFIFRKVDTYNFRCWRLADDTKLSTRRVTTTKKKK